MSTMITYGFFGEDEAQRNFLTAYLNLYSPDTFVENENFRWQIKARNRDQVDSFLPEALLQKAIFQLDVLFVGRDIDTEHELTIQSRLATFERVCEGHHPVVLMLPVQCVEHWLLYIKRRHDEPGKKSPLENKPRPDAKQSVYLGSKVVVRQLEMANEILVNLDVAWLESRSESFKHFHHQVVEFLAQYSKTTKP